MIRRTQTLWKSVFMNIAEIMGNQSNCSKIKVGAVIEKNRRIISTGYNGPAAGQKHCDSHFDKVFDENSEKFKSRLEFYKSEFFLDLHKDFSYKRELHAEANAILFADKSIRDCNIYVTYCPCLYCAKLILSSGIRKVFFKYEYAGREGLDFFEKHSIETEKII